MNKRRIETLLIVFLIIISLIYFIIDFSFLAVIVLIISCILLKFSYPLERKKQSNNSKEPQSIPIQPEIEETIDEVTIAEVGSINYPENFVEKDFLKDVFLLYKEVQTDFMNFDYNNLMHKLGIELYNQYSKQMENLHNRSKQAVRVNINLDKIQTESFIQDKDCYRAVINIAVSEDKYMKNINEEFRLTSARVRYESCYSMTVVKRHRKKIIRKCYNCNEKVQGNPYKCPFCNTMLIESTDNWIMTDLKLICSHSKKES